MATLEKRGEMYYSRVRIGGRTIHRALHQDRRIAEEMLYTLLKERNAGKLGHVPSDTPWEGFKRKYEAWTHGTKNRDTRYHNARAIRFLEEYRHISTLADITPEVLEGLRVHLIKDHRKPGINRAITALIALMHRAEEWKLVPPQNWRAVGRFKVAVGRVDFYTFKEYDQLLKSCKTDYFKTLALLGGRAGLRIGEIYHLEWKDVDFHRNRLDVCPKEGWAPKDYECRFIPLHPLLREHLLKWRKVNKSRWVMSDPETNWRPNDERCLAVEYKKAVLRGLGLRGTVHILRHTFGAHAVMNRVTLRKLKEWMGHGSIETTMIYAHLAPEELEAGIDALP